MGMCTRNRIAELAGRQYGVISVRQATDLGASRNLLASWARTGAAERVGHGVYRLAGWPDTWSARAVAVSLVVARHAAVSHLAAAKLLELALTPGQRRRAAIEITYFRRERLPSPPVRAHESNVLTADDLVRVGPVLVTNAVFTIGALAARIKGDPYFRLFDASVAAGHFTVSDAVAMAGRLWSCPGVPMLREAIERHHPRVTLTRSQRERRLFLLLRNAGLPLPDVDVRVTDTSGVTRYLDFAYVDLCLWIEFDSDHFHLGSISRTSDGRRQNNLVLLDGQRWIPLRFDDEDLFRDPEGIVDAVRRVLRTLGVA